MIKQEIPLIISSSTDFGAINKSLDGSSFIIQFQEPLVIPREAKNLTVEVSSSEIWWTVPNISSTLGNNKMYVEYNASNYIITIPDGLYDVDSLNNAIDRELFSATGVSGILTLAGDNATQKVEIVINVATVQIDFTPTDTFRDILGFNSSLVPSGGPTAGAYTQLADNVANFNTISYFLIHSDIVQRGLRTNNTFTQTIAKVAINVMPGSQIVAKDYNPPKSDASNLSGVTLDQLRVWLTDQDNNLVNTNGEDYSFTLILKFSM